MEMGHNLLPDKHIRISHIFEFLFNNNVFFSFFIAGILVIFVINLDTYNRTQSNPGVSF